MSRACLICLLLAAPAAAQTKEVKLYPPDEATMRQIREKHKALTDAIAKLPESPFKPEGSWADRIGATWVFNAGRQIGPVPCHVEIDLAQGTAAWRSMMGTESLSLAADRAPSRTVF